MCIHVVCVQGSRWKWAPTLPCWRFPCIYCIKLSYTDTAPAAPLSTQFSASLYHSPSTRFRCNAYSYSAICPDTMATAQVHLATAGTSRAYATYRVAPAGALHSAPFSSAASSPKRRSVLPAQRPARTAGLTCRAETDGEMREKVDEVEEILTKEPVKVEGTVKGALHPQLIPGHCAT